MSNLGYVEVQGLTLGFRNFGRAAPIVENLSIKFGAGSFTAIIGQSGCGKSTFLNAIGGHHKPILGRVLLDGCEVEKPSADLGIVFQQHTLFPWKTVKENVRFGPILRGVGKAEANELAAHYIGLVGLAGYEDYYPKMLSGGMQHRAEIARALANKPAVLLMDEPFGALDAQMRAALQEVLINIWHTTHITIIFVTHDVEEAIFLSEQVVVMAGNGGGISHRLTVGEPFPRKKTEFLLGEKARDLKVQCLKALSGASAPESV